MQTNISDRYPDWQRFRKSVTHPATIYKQDDFARARINMERHDWANTVFAKKKQEVQFILRQGPAFLEKMIPSTTPTCTLGFTNCPVCEGNTIHGQYNWKPEDPEFLTCTTCATVYPNEKFPEDIEFRADRHGGGQVITYHGGYTFDFHGFHLRSSWSGQIRARKVEHMAKRAQTLATLYALTGDLICGHWARDILLRFAHVYPNYLVHSSYGDWIDLPPHVVAENMNDLPEDEWTIPPNKPDRTLHTGYWSAGRAMGVGLEGHFVRNVTVAYDFIHDLLTEDERLKIETDLLLESTVLLLADPDLNNKSVANLSAAGLVGMAVGAPSLVDAGSKGFWHFVRNWYLPDGTTSESPAYGFMTLGGLLDFGEALHGYTAPAAYRESESQQLDIYSDRDYRSIYRALYDTLLPNLKYPASADSYVLTEMSAQYAELMVARYNLPEYRALLKKTLGGPLEDTGDEYALFHRHPDLAFKPEDRISFNDLFFPALRTGYLRSGDDGMNGTVILDASHWGVHHHRDSLNLTMFQEGHEVLTDLGYLWDRPDKELTVRTPAHNLVVVDESEQLTKDRLGSLHLFDVTPNVKVIECSSRAYAQTDLYRRTCILIDHGEHGSYLVDIFRVSGGTRHDYVFHGPVPHFQLDGIALQSSGEDGPYNIRNIQRGSSTDPWALRWQMDPEVTFSAWALAGDGEEIIIGEGWGERGWDGRANPPEKCVDIPYVIRRRSGTELASTFVSIFEVTRDRQLVMGLNQLNAPEGVTALEVETTTGTDVILASLTAGQRNVLSSRGPLDSDGRITVVTDQSLYLVEGQSARIGEHQIKLDQGQRSGSILEIVKDNDNSYFLVDNIPAQILSDCTGRFVLVDDGLSTTGYQIKAVETLGTEVRVYTKHQGEGYDIVAGKTWSLPLSAHLSW
jgi:hypothetical protein